MRNVLAKGNDAQMKMFHRHSPRNAREKSRSGQSGFPCSRIGTAPTEFLHDFLLLRGDLLFGAPAGDLVIRMIHLHV